MKRGSLLLLPVLFLAAPAFADDFDEGGTLYAIQNRKYVLGHEFTLGAGTVPMDAFYKGLVGTFEYTYHFSDKWAWEIIGFSYSKNIWTSLRDDLEQNWKVEAIASSQVMSFPVWTAARPIIAPRFERAARRVSLWGRSLRMALKSTSHSFCHGLTASFSAFHAMLD